MDIRVLVYQHVLSQPDNHRQFLVETQPGQEPHDSGPPESWHRPESAPPPKAVPPTGWQPSLRDPAVPPPKKAAGRAIHAKAAISGAPPAAFTVPAKGAPASSPLSWRQG